MLAAVMPLPSEEVTPPVTKTYFAMGQVLRGFFRCYRKVLRTSNPGVWAGADGKAWAEIMPSRPPLMRHAASGMHSAGLELLE
jgi:hypothetical protein